MALNTDTGSWVMNGGTLRNTVLTATDGAQLIFGSGALDGVTVNGDLDVGRQNSGAGVTVVNGLVRAPVGGRGRTEVQAEISVGIGRDPGNAKPE